MEQGLLGGGRTSPDYVLHDLYSLAPGGAVNQLSAKLTDVWNILRGLQGFFSWLNGIMHVEYDYASHIGIIYFGILFRSCIFLVAAVWARTLSAEKCSYQWFKNDYFL